MCDLDLKNSYSDVYKQLYSAKLKVTKARVIIFEIIQTAKQEITAVQIMNHLDFKNARISYGVVYATLRTLRKVGLIERFKYENEQARYTLHRKYNSIRVCCSICENIEYDENQEIYGKISNTVKTYYSNYESFIVHRKGCAKCDQ